MRCISFFRKGFKWIDPKDFDSNRYRSNCSKGFVLKFVLEYPKELCELFNDYPLVPDKIEIRNFIWLSIKNC